MDKKRGATSPGETKKSRVTRKTDRAVGIVLGVGVTVVMAWAFYDDVRALLMGMIIIPACCKYYEKYQQEKEKRRRLLHLREMLLSISSYMQAGASIENAFVDAEMELRNLWNEDSMVQAALHRMNEKIKINISVEQAFYELSKEIELEEAKEFSDILLFAKRLGGNYIRNIQNASEKIQDKIEVNQEIETILAEKRLELRVMVVMPMVILFYVKATSYNFIAGMYHTSLGVGIMTICLVVYVAMILWGKRMLAIRM